MPLLFWFEGKKSGSAGNDDPPGRPVVVKDHRFDPGCALEHGGNGKRRSTPIADCPRRSIRSSVSWVDATTTTAREACPVSGFEVWQVTLYRNTAFGFPAGNSVGYGNLIGFGESTLAGGAVQLWRGVDPAPCYRSNRKRYGLRADSSVARGSTALQSGESALVSAAAEGMATAETESRGETPGLLYALRERARFEAMPRRAPRISQARFSGFGFALPPFLDSKSRTKLLAIKTAPMVPRAKSRVKRMRWPWVMKALPEG